VEGGRVQSARHSGGNETGEQPSLGRGSNALQSKAAECESARSRTYKLRVHTHK
jgi:hypothetical protein